MKNNNENLIKWLFKTDAVRVCPQKEPFWYTSGSIGAYYINTHFLYGSESKASDLLKYIDIQKNNPLECSLNILDKTINNYDADEIYRGLIDEMCSFIMENIDLKEVDYISGGERRDWFFSLIIANILKKPHITIFKDLSLVVFDGEKVQEFESLKGKKVLHIADLITEASSYERAWIPAIKDKGGEIKWSVVVVDRKQGGEELLNSFGVKSFSMVDIDVELFRKVLSMGIINEEQFTMIEKYIENPRDSMAEFLLKNPDFLKNALASDQKTKERAKLLIQKDIYGLHSK